MSALILAVRRTAIAPRRGAFRRREAWSLAAALIPPLLRAAGAEPGAIGGVILGSALGSGGNPARLAALAGGLPETAPALSVDSQCCSGLDAIALAAERIAAGSADLIVAGGAESFSRAPLRSAPPLEPGGAPTPYAQAPFAPPPWPDPDMIEAAAALAAQEGVGRAAQEAYAIASHAKARAAAPRLAAEITPIADLHADAFARALDARLCARAPRLAGAPETAMTRATVAVEADGAALALLASPRAARRLGVDAPRIALRAALTQGGDPGRPALAPIGVGAALLAREGLAAADLDAVELMEAFAVQALLGQARLEIPDAALNKGGGALARGHPIAASGAVLAVRLWAELASAPRAERGLALIAGAGGLASALLLERVA